MKKILKITSILLLTFNLLFNPSIYAGDVKLDNCSAYDRASNAILRLSKLVDQENPAAVVTSLEEDLQILKEEGYHPDIIALFNNEFIDNTTEILSKNKNLSKEKQHMELITSYLKFLISLLRSQQIDNISSETIGILATNISIKHLNRAKNYHQTWNYLTEWQNQVRSAYNYEVSLLKPESEKLAKSGMSDRDIALDLQEKRRNIGKKYKSKSFWVFDMYIQYGRNMFGLENPLVMYKKPKGVAYCLVNYKTDFKQCSYACADTYGPTIMCLRKYQKKTWKEIIAGSYRTGGEGLGLKNNAKRI